MHHLKQVLCDFFSCLAYFMANLVSKNDRVQPVFLEDHLKSLGQSPVCYVGVSNEGCSLSTLIGASNDCKWVFNEASLMPWCQAVVYFEVQRSRFSTKVRMIANGCSMRRLSPLGAMLWSILK